MCQNFRLFIKRTKYYEGKVENVYRFWRTTLYSEITLVQAARHIVMINIMSDCDLVLGPLHIHLHIKLNYKLYQNFLFNICTFKLNHCAN